MDITTINSIGFAVVFFLLIVISYDLEKLRKALERIERKKEKDQ